MLKGTLLIAILLVLGTSLTDKEIIQQALNGAFEENKLPDPTTIVKCIDDKSAHQIVVFIGTILDKAAKGSISDLIQIVNDVKAFGATLDPAVGTCLDGNAEFEKLGFAYGIDNTTDGKAIEKKAIAYVTLHYLTVHKWFQGLDSDWHAAKYYQVGFNGATYAHDVLKMAKVALGISDKDTIQQTLNGVFEENKLPDPTTIVKCIDDKSANQIVVFAGKVLDKAAKGSIADLIQVIQDIKAFGDTLDPAVGVCLDGNDEAAALGLKYGIDNTTDTKEIEKKIVTYVTLHYLTVHKWLQGLDADWKAAKFYQVGFNGASYAHDVLKLTKEAIKNIVYSEVHPKLVSFRSLRIHA